MKKLTSSREFRKGRVLHDERGFSSELVLLNSPSPRTWVAGTPEVAPVGGRRLRVSTLDSAALKRAYTHWGRGIESPFTMTERTKVVDDLVSAGTVSKEDVWRIRTALGVRDALRPASSVPVVEEEVRPEKVTAATPLKRRSSSFRVPGLVEKPYFYESEQDKKLLRDFIALRQANFVVNLMISGPSGAGKTVGVQRLGDELGLPVHVVNCQAITTPEKWIGQMMADPARGTYFEPSPHIQWVERSSADCDGHDWCILLYDEITRLRPDLNNMTYSLFDTQKGIEVPQMGRRVVMSDRNIIISTANIGAAYAGTFGQDKAFRERFAMTMERDFPPLEEEVKILTSATGISAENARLLAQVAESSRILWRDQTVSDPISTRSLVTWGLLVAGGYDPMAAAEYTILPLYSEDGGVESDRARIRLQIEAKIK
jgi:MoxR-like ATPase